MRMVLFIIYENAAEREQTNARAVVQAQKEFGDFFKLIEMGSWATLDHCDQELALEERLDVAIDRLLKRVDVERAKVISEALSLHFATE